MLLASASKLLGASNQLTAIAVALTALVMVAVSLGLKARRKAVAEKPLVGADATAR